MDTSGSRATAIFAGGCFWCIEHAFSDREGVLSAVPGYTGGTVADPSYAQVSRGNTGHYEAVLVTYDPNVITYEQLLDVFWRQIDPTDDQGQFADKGPQYRTAIFYGNDAERETAEASKRSLEESGRFDTIVTRILPASRFWIAEEEHHDYAKNHGFRYKAYYEGSGRGAFCRRMWK